MKKSNVKDKTAKKFIPRMLYFKKDSMSIFTWLAMEKNEKKKDKR